jgi:hypothetical protein
VERCTHPETYTTRNRYQDGRVLSYLKCRPCGATLATMEWEWDGPPAPHVQYQI